MKFKAIFILLAVVGMSLLSCTDDEILTPNPTFKGNTDTTSVDSSIQYFPKRDMQPIKATKSKQLPSDS